MLVNYYGDATVEEAAKEIIVQQGPPLWVDFLAPAATLLAALVGGAVAYFLGRAQGRAQTLYVKRVEVMIELRRRILELGKYLSMLPIRSSPGDDKELIAKLDDVSEYHEDNLPWLEQETNEMVWLIHSSY